MTKQTVSHIKTMIHQIGLPLVGEGAAMLLCLIPALHFNDGTWRAIAFSGLLTVAIGLGMHLLFRKQDSKPRSTTAYYWVVMVWAVLMCFGTLPFITTSTTKSVSDALFESTSGLTSTGATIFPSVETLPQSVLLWRSLMQWVGGYGIVLLVIAIVPTLGINKYSLYTAEASGADNTGKVTTSVGATIRQTLIVYLLLTAVFITLLLITGMSLWEAVNLTFCNISSGGFSIYDDSLASLPTRQQLILTIEMFVSGINFMLMFHIMTFQHDRMRNKFDQLQAYISIAVIAVGVVVISLHQTMPLSWAEALKIGLPQTISALTTTGSLVADTEQWWPPLMILYMILMLCGGMAGSTTGGLKTMRILILLRNVRTTLRNRLHPHAVNPVRLNGKPVAESMIQNVMVTFLVFFFVVVFSFGVLLMCGIEAKEALGATTACLTGYGPGLGQCGGFGNYAALPIVAKWWLTLLMLMGRLECLTILIVIYAALHKGR